MISLLLAFSIGILVGVMGYILYEDPPRLSYFKRYMPWIAPAKVIKVDFKNKVRKNN